MEKLFANQVTSLSVPVLADLEAGGGVCKHTQAGIGGTRVGLRSSEPCVWSSLVSII